MAGGQDLHATTTPAPCNSLLHVVLWEAVAMSEERPEKRTHLHRGCHDVCWRVLQLLLCLVCGQKSCASALERWYGRIGVPIEGSVQLGARAT